MQTGYETMKVATMDKALSTSYSATIQGRQDIQVYPQVSGTIVKLCVTEGQKRHKNFTHEEYVPYVLMS